MARPIKKGVEYFPHLCTHGRTIYILEQRWGNDGYAFWFKLLELLGSTEGHVLDIRNATTREFLAAKTHLSAEQCHEILDLLADLDAIDQELWKGHQVIWCQNFVDHLEPVYRKRHTETPIKPSFRDENTSIADISVAESTQRKEKKRKEKKSKEKESKEDTLSADENVGLSVQKPHQNDHIEKPKKHTLSNHQLERFNQFWEQYPKKKAKLAAMKAWAKLKPDEILFGEIMYGLSRARSSMEWKREGGRFIPHPATFLNEGRWEDEYLQSEQRPTRRDLQSMSVEEYVEAVAGGPDVSVKNIDELWGDAGET